MPRELEEKLSAQALSEGIKGKKKDAYVFGTMNKMGMMHGNKITPRGEKYEKTHPAS